MQNRVGPEEYGIYFALFNFSFIFKIVLDFGLSNYNTREMSQHPQKLKSRFSNLIYFKLIFAAIYFVVTCLIGYSLGYANFEIELLLYLMVLQILLSLILFFRSNIAALQYFKTDAIMSVLDKTLSITFCAILLFTPFLGREITIQDFVNAQLLGLGLTAFTGFLIVGNKAEWTILKPNLKLIGGFAKAAYPFALLGLLMSIHSRTDAIMIERLLPGDGKAEAGVYAASFRLLEAFLMVGYLFATILLPLFSRMIKEKEDVRELVSSSFVALFSFSLIISVAGVFNSKDIIELLYINSSSYWADIFEILMLTFNFYVLAFIFGSLLTANGSLKQLNYIALCCVGLNVILNLVLIPELKAYGASIATLATQILSIILHIILAIRIFKIPFNGSYVVRVLLLILSVVTVNYLLDQNSLFEKGYWNALIAIVLSSPLPLILRLIEFKDVLKIIKLRS